MGTLGIVSLVAGLIDLAIVVAGLVGAGNTVAKWAKYFGLM